MSPRLVLALLLLGGCSSKHSYDTSLLRLATGFSAKETCSCLFVMGQEEEFCAEWTRVSPDIARFKVDYEAREVRSRALGGWKTVAAWQGEELGCVILP